jgi:hypothetical protein
MDVRGLSKISRLNWQTSAFGSLNAKTFSARWQTSWIVSVPKGPILQPPEDGENL